MQQSRKSLPKTALPRIYFIDQEIASGRYPTASSLAKKYETSLSSINRDIAYMRDMMDAPIEYDYFRKGFYYTKKTFRLPAVYASIDDVLAIGMAKNLLDLYRDTPIHAAALKIFENISTPLQGNQDAEWFRNRIVVPKTGTVLMGKKVWDNIVNSLRENRVITFNYLGAETQNLHTHDKKSKPKLEKRRVRPYQLLFNSLAWYLYAYDEDRTEMRMFALSRINGISLQNKTFTIEKDFDYREHEGLSYFGVYKGTKTFKFSIAITGDTRWIQERRLANDQVIQETKDGIELSFTSNQFERVLEWVLSQGHYARPLAPKELVTRWKETIMKIAQTL